MIVTADELAAFTGVVRDQSDTLPATYITSAGQIINNYLGYDVETGGRFTSAAGTLAIPDIIKTTCLRIAALLQLEESQNIGVNSKSFGDSGSRSFLNVTNYDPYLSKISAYRDGGHVI